MEDSSIQLEGGVLKYWNDLPFLFWSIEMTEFAFATVTNQNLNDSWYLQQGKEQ